MSEAGRRDLLVVDDDSIIRTLLAAALGGHYDVMCVPNGAGVPALMAERKPDLVVLDINVPGSEGYALCAGVRDQATLQKELSALEDLGFLSCERITMSGTPSAYVFPQTIMQEVRPIALHTC